MSLLQPSASLALANEGNMFQYSLLSDLLLGHFQWALLSFLKQCNLELFWRLCQDVHTEIELLVKYSNSCQLQLGLLVCDVL